MKIIRPETVEKMLEKSIAHEKSMNERSAGGYSKREIRDIYESYLEPENRHGEGTFEQGIRFACKQLLEFGVEKVDEKTCNGCKNKGLISPDYCCICARSPEISDMFELNAPTGISVGNEPYKTPCTKEIIEGCQECVHRDWCDTRHNLSCNCGGKESAKPIKNNSDRV